MTFSSPFIKDDLLANALQKELERQQNQLELIASENIASLDVLAAQGSVLTNKYAEGYPGRRYYGGCEFVDWAEELAIERAKTLFQCNFANVQPHSGANANQAVFLALLKPGDPILGLSLDAGGHLTHGSPVSLSGRWFQAIGYGVDPETHLIDYNEVERLAHIHRPRLIIAGGSAYPRLIDFERFRAIADQVGAYLMVDMAHFAGLVAGGVYPSPLPHAHVVTSTTHKTLRGPRGGLIVCQDAEMGKRINSAVFPGLQGGPLMHVIAAKAVAFQEALQPEFKDYAAQILKNAHRLASGLLKGGMNLVSGGTDSHLLLVDLRKQGLTGRDMGLSLESVNLTVNKNGVPQDPSPPHTTSGIRLGTPAVTTRGLKEAEMDTVSQWILEVAEELQHSQALDRIQGKIQSQVRQMCERFPLYPSLSYTPHTPEA